MKAWLLVVTAATILRGPAAHADTFTALGERLAAPLMEAVTDQTLAAYLGPALHVTESHASDCGATIRISSDAIRLRSALLALRRVADCSAPKPILAIRLTVDQPSAPAVIASMRKSLAEPCFDGVGAQGAQSVIWSYPTRITGVIQDPSPGTGFSVFWVNQIVSGSSDAQSEQMVRRLLEADLPSACMQTYNSPR